jgi:hypothetical protein
MAKAAAVSGLVDDQLYKVTVTRAVTVLGKLQWRPQQNIEATGALIKELVAKPENAGAIDANLIEIEPEAV